MNFGKFYMDLIVAERQWSWSLIGMSYLVITLMVRQLIFRMIVHDTRELDPQVYSAVKGLYLRKSPGGWILFFVSFLLVITAWVNAKGLMESREVQLLFCFLLPLLFFLSIILHLLAFTRALLATYRQKLGVEKEY